MSDVLNRIENTLANLCPCGAEPREGSAYCGDDIDGWSYCEHARDLGLDG